MDFRSSANARQESGRYSLDAKQGRTPQRHEVIIGTMVGVAQLVEPWIVIPVVVGSNPITHPKPACICTHAIIEGRKMCGLSAEPALTTARSFVMLKCKFRVISSVGRAGDS